MARKLKVLEQDLYEKVLEVVAEYAMETEYSKDAEDARFLLSRLNTEVKDITLPLEAEE